MAMADQEAADHFDRGVELYQEGNFDAALVELERAYQLTSNYRLLFNLGQIQVERQQYVEAIALYELYLERGGAKVPDARKQRVLDELTRLRERVARLEVATNVEGAELWIDERLVGTLPLSKPLWIDAGVSRVRVTKPGYEPHSYELRVAGGERPRLALPLTRTQPLAPPPAATPASSEPVGVRDDTPFWLGVTATGALAGASVTLALLAKSANDELGDQLDRIPVDREELSDTRRRVKTFAVLADGFGAAALVSAAVTTYFLLSEPHRQNSASRDSSLTLGVRDRGVTLSGSF